MLDLLSAHARRMVSVKPRQTHSSLTFLLNLHMTGEHFPHRFLLIPIQLQTSRIEFQM